MTKDQSYVCCPVCGKEIPYDRSSDEPQEFICSDECWRKLREKTGAIFLKDKLRKRAADPNVCLMCGSFLAKRTRSDCLYCSPTCQKKARRAGIIADSLVAIRMSALSRAEGRKEGGTRTRDCD